MKAAFLKATSVCLLVMSVGIIGCSKGSSTASSSGASEDTSTSGVAASAVGGGLSSSGSGGTYAFNSAIKRTPSFAEQLRLELNPLQKAFADTFCPTYKTANNSGCSSNASSDMWISYSDCTFAGFATWAGFVLLEKSAGVATCGVFPTPASGATLYRQFVTAASSTTPGSLTLTDSNGKTNVVDDASSNLANFNSDTVSNADFVNGGYGVATQFGAAGVRTSITIGHHLTLSGTYNHSMVTGVGTASGSGSASTMSAPTVAPLTITGDGAGSRTVNGSVTLYHNLLQIIAVATLNDVVHQDTCCLPVGGTITTAFYQSSSTAPTTEGAAYVGKSETLTLTGCGTGTLVDYQGNTSSVTINHCF